MLNTIALFVFPLLMAFAASSDLLTMRISNRLVLLVVIAFAIAGLLVGLSPEQFAAHFGAGLLVLVAGFALFARGWIGGGDAKLAAATTLWMGFGMTLPYLVYAAALGGVLTLLILAARNLPLPPQLLRFAFIERLHDKRTGIPYGIALAAAGLLLYSQTALFQGLVG